MANGWLTLLADEQLLELSRRTLTTREESVRLTKLRLDSGAASELDYRQAESLTQAARATLAQQQRQRALDENALALLLGQPLPEDIRASLTRSDLRAAPACRQFLQACPQICWHSGQTFDRQSSNWWRPMPTLEPRVPHSFRALP